MSGSVNIGIHITATANGAGMGRISLFGTSGGGNLGRIAMPIYRRIAIHIAGPAYAGMSSKALCRASWRRYLMCVVFMT